MNMTVSALASNERSKRLNYLQNCIYKLKAVSTKVQANENVVENFTQVSLLLMSILLSNSVTRVVENIDNIFVDNDSSLKYLFVGISLTTMVRGQIGYLIAHKNGWSSIKGTFLLAFYFLIGTLSRSENLEVFVQVLNTIPHFH